MKKIIYCFIFIFILFSAQSLPAMTLEDSINHSERSAKNVLRDEYRNPLETLEFFEIKANMTVIELSPGSGWYTEILSTYLYNQGKLIAAAYDPNLSDYAKRSRESYEKKLKSKEIYNKVEIVNLFSKLSDDGSIDAVLTFRNVHNWIGEDESGVKKIFQQAYSSLKPGGILGIVEHRANPGTSLKDMKKSGYVTEELTINLAKEAGFILSAKSEINANIRDTKDHPAGVWTLPPTLYLKDSDRDKYIEIGETDRMTLLFKKPS
ncbi:MAG: class I SAM-dependent methyltransferase [Alphaproteobacteria bacterium]